MKNLTECKNEENEKMIKCSKKDKKKKQKMQKKKLGIALMRTTCGKVYNGITDDDTHDDTLNLSIVHLLWCWGLVVCRVAARVLLVLPCARFPCCFGLRD